MLIPTLVIGVVAAVLVLVAWGKGDGRHVEGLRVAVRLTLQVIPLLAFTYVLVGMMQVLLPPEAVARWLGPESGLRGILIASFAGGLTPSGPYVSFPIAAGLAKAGVGLPVLVAYVTGWMVWQFARLPLEVGLLGWRFSLLRNAVTLLVPPLAGLVARVVTVR